jgi:uncharacterized protein YbcI
VPTRTPQSPESEISDEIATVYKARYGRGPTKITTHVLPEAVVCLLRDVNTPAQAALVQMGKVDVAQTVHEELQMGMADAMRAVVERVTGRTVSAYVPGFNAAADATTDVFFLGPGSTGSGARA